MSSPSPRVILVTGASGNISHQLIAYLEKHGGNNIHIRAAVRDPSKVHPAGANTKYVAFDSEKPDTVTAAFAGVDTAFVLLPFQESAVEMNKQFVAAAKAGGVKFIVKASALGADKNSPFSAPQQHGEMEDDVKASGIPATFLRPTFYSDNLRWQAGAIKGKGEFYGAAGEGKFSPIDSADIAEIAGKIILEPSSHIGQIYTLTGGELLTYDDEATLLSKYLGKPVKFVSMPVDKYEAMLQQFGQAPWNAHGIAGLEEIVLKGYAATIDPSAEKLLGRKPATVDSWIKANINIFQ